jgi:hypothetical protein
MNGDSLPKDHGSLLKLVSHLPMKTGSCTVTQDYLQQDTEIVGTDIIVTNSQVLYSRWKFTILTVQYTTLDYSSQLF